MNRKNSMVQAENGGHEKHQLLPKIEIGWRKVHLVVSSQLRYRTTLEVRCELTI